MMAAMITLHQFAPAFDLPVSVSPYCAKLELYFRLTGRAYETNDKGNPQKSPNKAVPYLTFDDGPAVAESRVITERLEAEGPSLDEGISEGDKKLGAEMEALVEDAHYFGCLYARFVEPAGWRIRSKR
jgi:glutathione S-transferase